MNDDLELDGNWSVSKKRKRSTTATTPETTLSSKEVKKQRGKGGKVLEAVLASELPPDNNASAVTLKRWAKTRICTSWAAEAKKKKMSPLEMKELQPLLSWFWPCPPQLSVQQVPEWAKKVKSARLQRLGQEPPSKGQVDALLLCASTDRVFAIKAAWDAVCPQKAVALAAHGGGRKKDQVLRQAQALEHGIALAIATPARLLRLKEEGHLETSKLGVVLVDLAQDMKKRDILTLQDTRSDFFKFLREIQALLPNTKVKVPPGLALLMCGA